uniref:Uncharacterized protein n=1 Tax=Otus sunia TaxID=257818 RepID=A0A8C8BPU3_9STRI
IMQHLSHVLRSWLRKLLCTNRLKTFTNWPFVENCKCTPENVSLNMAILTMPFFCIYTVPECEAIVKYIYVQEEL